jgi:hypothetical protein
VHKNNKIVNNLFIISGFDLDVDAPYPMPAPESLNERPLQVPIQKAPLKASHYGRNIENMLSLIAEHEEGEAKTAMILTLAGYMKQQYRIWNKETVSDETIFQDIEKLSDYRIKVPEGMQLGRVDSSSAYARPGINPTKNGKNFNSRQKNNNKMRKQHK